MLRTNLTALAVAAALLGCGMNPGPVAEPVQVNGKVVTADGRPVGGVVLQLQPTKAGVPAAFRLKEDGTFSGPIVPGKYAFYFERGASAEAFQQIPRKYHQASLDQLIDVSGQNLDVKLAP